MAKAPLTKNDLAWFDIKHYSPVRLRRLPLAEWAHILEDRLMLLAHLHRGEKRFVTLTYNQHLADGPLGPGPALATPWTPSHETDTPSVWLASNADVVDMASRATLPKDPCTPYALPDGKIEGAFDSDLVVPVNVDLRATRKQLEADFGLWLDNMERFAPKAKRRDYRTVVKEWAEHDYLPYFDIWLYSAAMDMTVSQEMMVELLGHDVEDPTEQLMNRPGNRGGPLG